MRKLILLLTIGLFMSATAANACDGDKATTAKGKKASALCAKHASMKKGKCTMTAAQMKKSGCCMHGATASMAGCPEHASKASMTTASAKAGGECAGPAKTASAGAKHDCCKAKADAAPKS